ncbi:pre-rRNA-processing protein ESF1 [Achlya hypogyna]|uniref:Pre-rRNA-processing protein ESF1 n=1 Tax=Achlya hypogyna TaxID=1202772 RepID=A0A1V9YB66_ACHHY|nr:pre-rRNA-processing protein ESF1 [Achlya hypogyna]
MSPPTNVVSDPRFSKVHNDPRFARNSKKRNKVQLDKRFEGVLTDKKFQSVQGKYDKYGRRIEKQENEMKKYYNLEDDEDEDIDDDETAAAPKKPMTAAEKRIAHLNKMARGELSDEGSSSSDSSDSEDDAEAEDEEADVPAEDIPMGEETKRIAIMNCDWSRMRAVDLYALFQSFVPASGVVVDVTIYPSEFGLEKMAEEEKYGPRGLWADEKKESDDEDDEVDEDDPLGMKKAAANEEEFDKEKLRQFELQKLKYYYGVATFNSVATAAAVFDACDGLEYETSANTLDLRFVPDDVTFKHTPKETATSVPESYTPAIFATLALQNTELQLTWEADDGERNERLTRIANWKDMDDDAFAQYVASEASSSEAESDADGEKVEQLKQKYRAALLGDLAADDAGDDSGFNDDFFGQDGVEEGGMEMTFTPGAAILEAKKQKEREANETPFEKYQREKKAEKNDKKRTKKQEAKAAHAAQLAALKKAKKGKKPVVDADGSDGDERDFDMKVIAKVDKHKDKKGKRHKKELAKLQKAAGLQSDFTFDATDDRFGQLVNNNPDFSLDPTDARFKRTEATEAIFEARRKKQQQQPSSGSTGEAQGSGELKSLVDSLKRKAKAPPKQNKKQRF